jgi:hypothetical protein
MHSDSEREIYDSRASLVVTDTTGAPIDLPENVRVYLMANHQHFPPANARPVASAICEQPINPVHAGGPMRALLVAMEAWLTAGTAPPPSRYPSRRDGTLVPPQAETVGFPAIPGFAYRGLVNRAAVVDAGAMPPVRGAEYPAFVERTDADGHAVAGIRVPSIDAPVATYTGWNYRKRGYGEGDLCDLTGATLPLAKTRAERAAAGDPRLSLEERYPNPGDYREGVARSAHALVAGRLLLEEDAERMIQAAERSGPQRASR